MITIEALVAGATAFLLSHPKNKVAPEDAMREDLAGMQIYDAPIFAVGDAKDPLFAELKKPEAIHPEYPLPKDWLEDARCVVAFFAPFTARVKEANQESMREPSEEWMHARIEGEEMLSLLRRYVRDWLIEAGASAVAPQEDARYRMLAKYAANWSERHTGYICGLGTFGMSKGLITEKGVAGRVSCVITSAELPITKRPYESLYANCVACGACAVNCPAQCIDPSRALHDAKAHPPCNAFVAHTRYRPAKGMSMKQRYGCGKCQVAVPCRDCIP